MFKISRTKLIEIIKGIKGVTFANVTYFTDESKSKTVNKVKLLQKEVTLNVTLNANYENKVNRIKENKQGESGNFESQGMKGKRFMFENCRTLVETEKDHKILLYCMREHNAKSRVVYFHNGITITKDKAIEKDLFAPSFFKPKPTAGRGEVNQENDFSVFTVGIDKIKRITIGGNEYLIED